jgi:hypothetical protein
MFCQNCAIEHNQQVEDHRQTCSIKNDNSDSTHTYREGESKIQTQEALLAFTVKRK